MVFVKAVVGGQAAMQLKRSLHERRAAVSLIFATSLIPLLMLVGLAIDFGFYVEAQTQLDMAADAAAMHAARVAAALMQANDPDYISKGEFAGQQWFVSQQGRVPQALNGQVTQFSVNIPASAQGSNQITATVQFTGNIVTQFAGLFPKTWPSYPYWSIAGISTAVITIPSFIEVDMLLDNSSSMLIAADQNNILAMEKLTPCSTQAANNGGQDIDNNYSWAYTQTAAGYVTNPPSSAYSPNAAPQASPTSIKLPYGYGSFVYPIAGGGLTTQNDSVPPATQVGQCDQNFHGPAAECLYPTALLTSGLSVQGQSINSLGQCTLNGVVAGGGAGSILDYAGVATPSGTPKRANMPQAPCAFACHNQQPANAGDPTSSPDYFGLAAANGIHLRYNVLQTDAANVITTMLGNPAVNQLSVGVYQFNAPGTANAQPLGISQVYPASTSANALGSSEAGPVTTTAATLTAQVLPPVTGDAPDTDFESAMTNLGAHVTASGSGMVPTAPRKNLFIVTDGMDDHYTAGGGRVQGAIDPTSCSYFKNPVVPSDPSQPAGLGFTVYVLYIQYLPLPNPWYLNSGPRDAAEPAGSSPIEQALKACASPGQYYSATSQGSDINNALQQMLKAALNSPGRFSE
jgi:Flp pilus assembly protein TadG